VCLSAYIRLAEVGVGCEPWPACYAILDPASEKRGITVLTEQGRDMAYRGARLTHRYVASILGFFIVALAAIAIRQRKQLPTSLAIPLSALAITVFLAILGYYTPTRTNPLITMGNLLGGMALLAVLWWMMQRNAESPAESADPALRRLVLLGIGLVCLQISLGGWSSANYASTACSGLYSCESTWWRVSDYQDGYTLLHQIPLDVTGQVIPQPSDSTLTMTHRGFALLTAGYLAWLMRRVRIKDELRTTAIAVSLFSISLIIAGVALIWLQLPLALLSLHNALAAGLLLSMVQLLHRLTPQSLTRPTASQPLD